MCIFKMEKNQLFLEEDSASSFPKIIHQTYISEESIPLRWKESITKWREFHSSPSLSEKERGEYVFWSDEDNLNFVKEYFPDFVETFVGYKHPIQRADAIRYMILYVYGGIYSDLDIIPKKNIFNHFSNGDIFLIKSANAASNLTNCLMASRPKQNFWLEVIDEMKKCSQLYNFGKHFKVLCTTGPLMLTRVFKKTTSNITLLPNSLFGSMNAREIENGEKKRESLLDYVDGRSWHSIDSFFFDFFAKLKYIFLGMGILGLFLVIFFLIKFMVGYMRIRKNCDVVCPLE